MEWKRCKKEFEANMFKPTGFFRSQIGEVEITLFDDGEARLELELSVPSEQHGVPHALRINQKEILVFTPESKRLCEKYWSKRVEGLEVEVGSKVEILVNGDVWIVGEFRWD